MSPFVPSLLLVLLLAGPALPTPATSKELQVGGQRTPRDAKQDSIKVVISEGCATHGDSSDGNQGGKEIDLVPGSPLILTHKIKLVPSGSGSCGCEADFAALRERLERLEREVSALREKCGGAEGSCCTSKESKGAGCSIKPEVECPNECSDQGRCVDGRCVCFVGFGGPDCGDSDCPGNCNNNGRCVDGRCACDPGFAGPDCSRSACPDDCNGRGRCVNGRCACDAGFAGSDCSDASCPGNCNNRGRCVNGRCACDAGFAGPDCSKKSCPGNCGDRGSCVDGKCACDDGFAGADCSEHACPGNCNNRGRCVDGECVCDEGFGDRDCSERTCPKDCSDRGRCVNGKCVCDVGFAGDDCSGRTCPNDCSGRGKCVNGKCVCDVGFAGPDCAAKGCPDNCNSRGRCVRGSCVCRRGFAGPDCSRCQDGMTGPNCDVAMSGVSQLSTQDITETSVTVVWTPPPVQYDTYRLTFTSQKESDQQITVQVEGSLTTFTQTGLAAGQEYRVSIVGEIDGRTGAESTGEFVTLLSGPANLQVVKTTSTSTVVQWEQSRGEIDRYRLTVTPNGGGGGSREMTIPAGQNSAHIQQLEAGRLYDVVLVAERGSTRSEPATTQAVPGNALPRVTTAALGPQVTPAPGRDVAGVDRESNPSAEVQVFDQQGGREDFGDSSASAIARTKPLIGKTRPTSPRKPGPFRFNATRVVPGGRKFVPGAYKKAPVVVMKHSTTPQKPKPGASAVGDSVRDQILEALSPERREDKNPDSPTNRRTNKQPDVGLADRGNDTDPVSPEPTGTARSQEKKCMNKVKVTHFRLPPKDRGCRGDGTGVTGNTLSGETDLDYSPDPLHKLLTDTFDSLNITTFSVHLSKPADVSEDADRVTMQILRGLKPLGSSSSSSQPSSESSSSRSSDAPSSLAPSSSVSSTAAPLSSLGSLISSPSSSSPSSSSPSSSANSDSLGSDRLEGAASPEDQKPPPSGEGDASLLHQAPPKRGFVHRPHANFPSFQNKTRLSFRVAPRRNFVPRKETEAERLSTSELSFSSASEESSSDEVNAPVKNTSRDKDGTATPASSGVGLNTKKRLTERGRLPVRRLPPEGGYQRRPFLNGGPFQNRTRPNSKSFTRPSQPLNPERQSQKEQAFSTELPATSPPSLPPAETHVGPSNTGTVREENEPSSGATEIDQTLRGRGGPSLHRPNTKVAYFRRPQLYSQNKTRTNLRNSQNPLRGLARKPFQTKKLNGGGGVTVGSQTSQLVKDSTLENQSGEQDAPWLTQGVQTRQSGEQETADLTEKDGHDTTVKAQTDELGKRDDALNLKEETSNTDSVIHKERIDVGGNTGATLQGRPTLKRTSSDRRASRPVTLPKRPPTRTITAQHDAVTGIRTRDDHKTNHTAKTGETGTAASDVSSKVTREPLDFVGVTNRTSDGFTLTWDAPEGKYKNFVVTRKEAGKDEHPKLKERIEEPEEEGSDDEDDSDADERMRQPTEESQRGTPEDDNRVPKSFTPKIQSGMTAEPTESDKTFKKVLPGSARSFRFEDLIPQTDYTLTLLGKAPGLLSGLHKLVISTGPEPPSDIVFSKVTENSLTVSWTKPKSPVSGFKVTYTHVDDGEPVSVSVDSADSSLGLSQLSPGSSYEVSIISTFGLDESDPIKDLVMTIPDPPTDLRTLNVTDTSALLLWRPALAAVDKYAIVYGAGSGSELRVTVSGNAAEQQLSGLEGSTTYTVTIVSQLGSAESSPATTSFTTTSGSGRGGEAPRDLLARDVTPRTVLLSWKPPSQPAGRYRLTYQTESQEMKEVIVDATVTQYNLTKLHPGSVYTARLQAETGGQYTSAVSTEFTTGTLRFPFPTDCSQELLNGIRTSSETEIFPQGKLGTPMMVYCDMETDGGGWTVFQRRKDGSVDFFRGWKDYSKGFGDLSGEFWLGLESIHNLTAMTNMNLRVDLRDGGESAFAQYSTFAVAKRNYKLSVGGYSGTAGDSLSYHNNRIFSTKDRDPQPFITRCALSYRGGWWYKNCHEANLNGLFGIDVKHQGLIWTSWKGKEISISFTEMKMRPAAFRPPARG